MKGTASVRRGEETDPAWRNRHEWLQGKQTVLRFRHCFRLDYLLDATISTIFSFTGDFHEWGTVLAKRAFPSRDRQEVGVQLYPSNGCTRVALTSSVDGSFFGA
jgi:hypothetical protein